MKTDLLRAAPGGELFNRIEQDVYVALQELPSEYTVIAHPEAMRFERQGVPYGYEPDFMVVSPEGRKLIVEVKSHHSLSLANLARFSAIAKEAQAEGAGFVVVVPDAPSPLPRTVLQDRDVQIVAPGDKGELLDVVQQALGSP